SFVRVNPQYIPLLILGAIVLGFISSFILKRAKDCRGGGIPTAIVAIRGIVPLKWVQGIFALFASAMVTYLAGVPLGNEGPSVQMGTAVGKGTVELTSKKKYALDRYGMTGGACAGFATALRAPLSGIMFALEEAHRSFSPAIFIVAAVSVLSASFTQECLSRIFGFDIAFFHFKIDEVLPLKSIWAAVLIGLFCGLVAILFTKFYRFFWKVRHEKLSKIPFTLAVISVFCLTAVLGFINADFVGSGHSLIEKIFEMESVWYILIIALLIRALMMIFANNEGITGGLFVPTLVFGAIIANLISTVIIKLGLVDVKFYPLLIAIGMSSYLAAASRTPITAITFAAEALCGVSNILSVGGGVVMAYIVIELSEIPAYTETVIESKIHKAHKGIEPTIVNKKMVVQKGSFAVGKEIRDIMWPHSCIVFLVKKNDPTIFNNFSILHEGDELNVNYKSYYPEETEKRLAHLLG
ncbi:MAG: chloride channel protein, partial [Clostridia bacterium]|nr:chloride channel protein [Clostridia bacterium]